MAKTTKKDAPAAGLSAEAVNPFDSTVKRAKRKRAKKRPKLAKGKSTGGRPPWAPSDEDKAVGRALAQVGMTQEDIAHHFGIGVHQVVKHFADELRKARGSVLAHGYGAVAKALKAEGSPGINLSAGKFILGTKGRDYGWGSPNGRSGGIPDEAFAGADPTLLTPKQWDTLVDLFAIMGVDLTSQYGGGRTEPKLIGSSVAA